jgi:hypothetical protein
MWSITSELPKSVGERVGLALDNACFSHGQFYVGCSRVGREINLKIMAPDNKTVNVVYKEIL